MSLLLYIHCVTPEGSNWVLVLRLWMLDLALWVARGQESLFSPRVGFPFLDQMGQLSRCIGDDH